MLHQKKSSKINDAQVFNFQKSCWWRNNKLKKKRREKDGGGGRDWEKEGKEIKEKKSNNQSNKKVHRWNFRSMHWCNRNNRKSFYRFAYTENGLKLKALAFRTRSIIELMQRLNKLATTSWLTMSALFFASPRASECICMETSSVPFKS